MSKKLVVLRNEIEKIIEKRSQMTFQTSKETQQYWQECFQDHHMIPSPQDLKNYASQINIFLQNNNVCVVISIKEIDAVTGPVLQVLTQQISPNNIIVIDDESNDKATGAVRTFSNVYLIKRNNILDCLNWDKLFPLLNLTDRPKGKGIRVLASYLA